MTPNYEDLLAIINAAAAQTPPGEPTLEIAMQTLHSNRPDYHWVGIYYLRGSFLHLGPYCGPTTDHVKIPVGRGVCGTAIAENRNQIISDVRKLDNYLACNLETRSEIVVLIRDRNDNVLGQIDVDGTDVDAFGNAEEAFLEQVASLLAPHIPSREP